MDETVNNYVQGLINSLGVPNSPDEPFMDNDDVRREVAKTLETLGPIIVESLINTLKDQRTPVREFSVEVLGHIGDSRALEPLIVTLNDCKPNVRLAAAKALGKFGNAGAIKPLIKALRDESLKVRESAIEALGNIGDPLAVEPLIKLLEDTEEFRKRYNDTFVTGLPIKFIGYSPENSREITELTSTYKEVYEAAAYALGKIKNPRAIEALIATINNDDFKILYRWFEESYSDIVRKILIEIGEPAVKPLIAALIDENSHFCSFAARTLLDINGEFAIEPIITALKESSLKYEESENFSTAVSSTVSQIRIITPEPLFRLLKDDNANLRIIAIHALGNSDCKSSIETLISMLEDLDKEVRATTVKALKQLGDARAIDPLIASLQDPDSLVRGRAAYALGSFKDEKIIGALLPLLGDEDPFVIGMAATVLGNLRDIRAVEPLITALKHRSREDDNFHYVANALGKISGLGFSYDTEKWEKWWEEYKQKRFIPPK